jgi:hypothetical protein
VVRRPSIGCWVAAIGLAGGGLARAADAALLDACTLLTSAEISSVLKLPVEAGTRADTGYESDGSYSSSCIWTVMTDKQAALDPTAPMGGKRFVILNAIRWPAGSNRAGAYLEAFREASRKGDIDHTPQPKPFGDEALWWGDGLAVRRGDIGFGISVFVAEKPEVLESFEEALAPLVLRHL